MPLQCLCGKHKATHETACTKEQKRVKLQKLASLLCLGLRNWDELYNVGFEISLASLVVVGAVGLLFPVLFCKARPHVSCRVTSCRLSWFPSLVIVLISLTCLWLSSCVCSPCDFLLSLSVLSFGCFFFPRSPVFNYRSLRMYLSACLPLLSPPPHVSCVFLVSLPV